ncbi:uncharacterized protein [Clytia hemisphaerica]|uniref:Cnidarian restricted protein n=1 Tax=Clytia hemisphaerica TaxID=252671 RepID=A0A7M5WVW4_9CNID|eukprot:TCONS_00066499-protein
MWCCAILALVSTVLIKGNDGIQPTYLSLSINNHLDRSITIKAKYGEIKPKTIQPSDKQTLVDYKDIKIREIAFEAFDMMTGVPLALNGDRILKLKTSFERYKVHIVDVKPLALDYMPSYLYTFKNNELTGYPFLNPVGNTTPTIGNLGIDLSKTELVGEIRGCFLKPDDCTNGTTIGVKLKFENISTDNSQRPKIQYILRSHGIELIKDQYKRLCGLVRSHYPSREWKVCFRGVPTSIWIYLTLAWHPRRGIKMYINSRLVKTNRYGRTINQRLSIQKTLRLGDGHPDCRLASLSLVNKQLDESQAGLLMLFFWKGDHQLFWTHVEFYNFALLNADVSMNGKHKYRMRPNTFVTITSKNLIEDGHSTAIVVRAIVANGKQLYVNRRLNSLKFIMKDSVLNHHQILITHKLYKVINL